MNGGWDYFISKMLKMHRALHSTHIDVCLWTFFFRLLMFDLKKTEMAVEVVQKDKHHHKIHVHIIQERLSAWRLWIHYMTEIEDDERKKSLFFCSQVHFQPKSLNCRVEFSSKFTFSKCTSAAGYFSIAAG